MALLQTAVFAPVQETVRMAQVHILTGLNGDGASALSGCFGGRGVQTIDVAAA